MSMFFRKRKNPDPAPFPVPSEEPAQLNRASPRSPSEAIKPTAAPPPPDRPVRERGGLLSTISGLLTAAVILAIAAMIGVTLFDRQIREPGPLAADKVVVIPPRSGTSEIAEALSPRGRHKPTPPCSNGPRGFSGKALKAGEYTFKSHASIGDAIETLSSGRQVQHAITFPEGLTSEQIVVRLNDNDILSGDINEIPPEGSLLPDTYKFERGATRQQIVNLMRAKQREVLNQIWLRRSAEIPVKTPAEMVTLASIVEKETGRADERPRVAGVFVNRLNKRMKLQSDPTIVYGLVGGRGTLGRGIQRSEIDRATPYNTYVIEGPAPGTHRQSGPRGPGGGGQSRRAPRTCSSWPTAPAATPSPRQPGGPFAQRRPLAPGREAPARTCRSGHAAPVDKADPPGDPASVPGTGLGLRAGGHQLRRRRPRAGRARVRRPSTPPRAPSLDPLRNKTFDLNSAKSVPALKPQ